MASRTANLLLADLSTGESGVLGYDNWGAAADDNFFRLEDALTETSTIALTGSNVTLTDEEERSVNIVLTGTLSASVEVRTNDRKGFWFVTNNTTGAYTVTFKPTSGSGVTVGQGSSSLLVCDGTDIKKIAGSSPSAPSATRNRVVNGNFDFWQIDTNLAGSGYSADQWKRTHGSGAAGAITRQSHTIGQTDVPGEPRYFLRWARSTAGSTATLLENPMEGVRTLAGMTATVTFYAKASATTTLQVDLVQNFGTGGSPSTAVTTAVVAAAALTTSWQKFTYTVSVPSISGKTIGSNEDDALWLRFTRAHNSSNATADVDISRVSVVVGDATGESDPIGPVDLGIEHVRCLRYYWKTAGEMSMFLRGSTASARYLSVIYPAPMRAAPSISFSSSSGTPTSSNITSTSAILVVSGSDSTTGIQVSSGAIFAAQY